MTAATEREVFRVGPADVEAVGFREALGIVIGGAEDGDHDIAAADRVAAELDVGRGPAVQRPLDRPFVAQHLLDRARNERWVGSHLLELLGMCQQVDDGVADQADRRLVAGDDQEYDRAEQLRLRERVLVVAGGQERADQIVARLCPPGGEESRQVRDEIAHLRGEPLELIVVEHGRDDRVRPLLEASVVAVRYSQHLGDHRDREREGVLGGEIHLPARLHSVQQLVGDRLDPRAQLLDHFRRERLRDQAAQAAVVVAVAVEHVVLDQLEGRQHRLRGQLLLGQREPLVADETLVVEQHRGGVLVSGDEPDHALAVDAGLADDGIMLAHLREDPLRIGAELRPVQVVLALRRRHFQPA